MQQQLIKYLCDSFSNEHHSYSELDQNVFRYLMEKKSLDKKFSFHQEGKHVNPIEKLSLWRNLLKMTLLISFKESEGEYEDQLKKSWYDLSSQNTLKEFQIEQAYTKLIAFLLNIPYSISLDPFQLESGFTPIESGLHWPIMNTPLLEWQAELGCLWVLLGRFLNEPKYLNYAQKLATWQLNSLDQNYKPFKGFLSSHHLSHYANTLLWQGVLFHSIALANRDSKMAYLAKQQFSNLLELDQDHLSGFSPTALLILDWIDLAFKEQLTPIEPKLSSIIHDPDLALVGHRSSNLNLFVSLLGTNMGFGSLKHHDIEIPAFGPQLELLGEGKLFGFLGQNPLNPQHRDRYKVDLDQEEFNIKGVVGLPKSELDEDYLKRWHYPSNWMESNLFFEDNALNVHLTPYRMNSKLFFVFYVIAKKCLINGEEKILPNSLKQYQGEAAPVSLVGEKSVLTLDSPHQSSQLKIIPLEGHRSFWGANYLIAYHLNNKYSTFKWKISMSDL